ncbi:LPD7 domain-containing protein [Aeromonas hydrophila]|uniref:LPD7 domain-containing protein n=1 Tax=Aeromonas hydrophila TaxID=644 RepID=UPI000C32ABBF|nr:LPD7 domain-containing protein [Aeromonas hydrophila]PKD22496.1 DNA primase [Aeromonas hydrophila]
MANIAQEKTYLAIPFEERKDAFRAAGKLPDGKNALGLDEDSKLWFANPGADLDKLKKWIPDTTRRAEPGETDPVIEFGQALEDAGFILDGEPQMDGKKHRVSTVDDRGGQKSGVYVGYLDGVPAGWYQDHRIHSEPQKWKATGNRIDPEAQAHLKAVAAQRKIERDQAQARQYDHNAHRSQQAASLMPDANGQEQYLVNKGVKAFPGVKTDKRGRVVIPLQNEKDEVRTLQRISGNGFKSLKKNGQKSGSYFVVGGELKNGDPILYAEGYSTSATISEATGRPVVMTVDAGNMPTVAAKLLEKYPDSQHVFLADDDRKNTANKGKEKAEQAATITNGIAQTPIFNNQEIEKGFSDFNDLGQSRGLEVVREQVEATLNKVATVDKVEENTGPVITDKFEREIDTALSNSEDNQKLGILRDDQGRFWDGQEFGDLEDAKRYEPVEALKVAVHVSRQYESELEGSHIYIRAVEQDEPSDSDGVHVVNTDQAMNWPHLEAAYKRGFGLNLDRDEALAITARSPAAALDNQEQAAAPAAALGNQEPEENAVEPFIERKIETADADVRAWLTNSRQPIGELIEEDERKAQHRPQAEGEFSSEPSQTPKGQASNSDFEATTFKPIVPEKVAKSYIEVDGKYYFGNRPDSLAFVDKGAKLQTKLSSEQVAASMVDIAEARGWTELQLSGTEDFRRAAWLEAASRGLASRGYKPKEEDLARLKKLTNDRTSNEIEPREQADVVPPAAKGKEQPTNQDKQQGQQAAQSPQMAKAAAATATADKQQPEAAAPAQEVNRLAGKLVEHGKAPYEHNPDNNGSYFVTLENADGQQSTTWGVGLEKAIEESQAEAGQHVELENLGRKPVQVEKQIKDEKGNVTGTKTVNSYRNEWAVKAEAIRDSSRDAKELVKEHPDLINEITAVKLAEKFAAANLSAVDQARFMERVRGQVADNVSTGQQAPELKIREETTIERTKETENER